MLSDEEKEKAWSETEIRFRADLLILNSEFPTHRKTEAMEELLEIYNKQSKEIEELKAINKMQRYRIEVIDERELISKDIIKARIEELEEYLYRGSIKDDFLMIRIKAKIQELQSLLEKE